MGLEQFKDNREQLENSIKTKLENLCQSMGEIYYEKVNHKAYTGKFKSLDIFSKKEIINEMNDIIIYAGESFPDIVYIDNKNEAIDIMEQKDGSASIVANYKGTNPLINKKAIWFRLYKTDENGELQSFDVDENIMSLKLKTYLIQEVIRYAILNDLKLPYVEIKDIFNLDSTLYDINEAFTIEEMNFISEILTHKFR